MSDQEKFLARWSRRKLKPADKQAPEESPTAADAPPIESAPPAPKAEAPEFDVSTLPSLEFDRRHVRHPSVPASGGSLRAQACGASARVVNRSGDPRLHRTEREFLGRRGPGGVPGFGELDPTLDVKKLIAEMFGEVEQEPRGATETVSPADQSTRADDSGSAAPAASEAAQGKSQPSTAQDTDPLLQRDENVASHHDAPQQEAAASRPRRHGGAMPE